MTEYIEREAALEIAMQYCPDGDGSCSKAGVDMREMLDEIESIPAADVVEVVRCKDCYFYAHDQSDSEGIGWCGNTAGGSGCGNRPVYDSFFCACGSMRTNKGWKWIWRGFNIVCPICQYEPYFARSDLPKFCPNCGARMDGDGQ